MLKTFVPTAALVVAVTIGSLSMPLAAQTDAVSYTDMAAIVSQPYGPFPEARAVLGETSSIPGSCCRPV